ncbi:LANO_0G02124g1_1 [Lachancea nothofagi CBS 11611]|uniref:LANO_0G02124g1_1 n=1 Tax=Lachancea nothofagi CBS 11611 TaxID=1266666 RepID=A0A1G4KEW7_9SACH|nr:LANO_0G02124g1_1 [Lachancea nothofagi CBS 11611]
MRGTAFGLLSLNLVSAVKFIAQVSDTAVVHEILGQQYEKMDDNNGIGAIRLSKSFQAIYGDFPDHTLESMYYDGRIIAMSMDRTLTPAEYVVQAKAPSHLARLSQKAPLRKTDKAYIYHSNAGIGVDVYLLDTGIDAQNPAFEDRVQKVADYAYGPATAGDPHGHGTAVAGVIGSSEFGVAKKCNLFDVRIANADGNAGLVGVIRALEHVTKLATITNRPSLVVIPYTMAKNVILNAAVEAVVRDLSIPVIVAGGNNNQSACTVSPASAYGALSIGAIDVTKNDETAPFTNYGECIDVFAAGVDVSTIGLDSSLETKKSGTSVSAGIASGLVAYFMSLGFHGMDAVNRVKTLSASNVIPKLAQKCPSTRNAILQNL